MFQRSRFHWAAVVIGLQLVRRLRAHWQMSRPRSSPCSKRLPKPERRPSADSDSIMDPFGFLVVDKPQGMTSHDVISYVRRGIGHRRIGHAGTLEPMATGALILCIGLATRLSEYVMSPNKRYTATMRLGIETDTYDAEGLTLPVAVHARRPT